MISKDDDRGLRQFLDLDETRVDVGGGYWVALRAKRVPPTEGKPQGIDYSLCLIGPDERRVVCYDNAHATGKGRTRTVAYDHRHFRGSVKPYRFSDPGTLLTDFWNDVYRIMKDEGLL